MRYSIDSVLKAKELQEKVFPTYEPNANEIEQYKDQMEAEVINFEFQKLLNQKQKEAIYGITQPVYTTFCLFGPPGFDTS